MSSFPRLIIQMGKQKQSVAGLEIQKSMYKILVMSSFEKQERFLGEFYLRLNEKK